MNEFQHLEVFQILENRNLAPTFILLALVLVLSIAYVIRSSLKGRAHFARVDKQGGSALLSKSLMEMAYWWLQPIGRLLVFFGVTPNQISFASLVFGFLAGVSLAFGHFGFGGAFALVAGFMDSLDGMVARLTNRTTRVGEILDATVDRYVESFFCAGLIVYYAPVPVLQILALFALIGSYMVSYSSAKAEAFKVDPPKGSMRRPERAVYMTLGAVLSPISITLFEGSRYTPIKVGYPMVAALGLIAVMANASAIERMWAIGKAARAREEDAIRLASQSAQQVSTDSSHTDPVDESQLAKNPARTR